MRLSATIWMIALPGLFNSCNPEREPIHIPDPAFVTALIANGVDKNADLQISREEAEEVTDLDVSGFGIKDLTGLQEFIRLVSFHCLDNRLTKLDVSQNNDIELLNCHNNDISQLDVTQNPKLEILGCSGNQLTHLDVSQNPELVWLNINFNSIEAIDLLNNPELEEFRCLSNPLTSLDMTGNPDLIALFCFNNPLRWLDISVNTQIEFLLLEECHYLEEICVWTLPFPPAGTEALIINCPSSYLTTDCTH